MAKVYLEKYFKYKYTVHVEKEEWNLSFCT
jgi:hypothetical protein